MTQCLGRAATVWAGLHTGFTVSQNVTIKLIIVALNSKHPQILELLMFEIHHTKTNRQNMLLAFPLTSQTVSNAMCNSAAKCLAAAVFYQLDSCLTRC